MPYQDSNKTLTVDGKLSLDKISSVDAALATAAREGLNWTVINKDVAELGEVLCLLQASQNSVSAISRPDDEFQIVVRIYTSQVGDPNKAWPNEATAGCFRSLCPLKVPLTSGLSISDMDQVKNF